ncbi:MAG: hypothetical protein WC558_07725 [Patulibacter sp.]
MALKTQSKKQLRKQAKNARKQVAAREDTVRNLLENQDLHEDLKQLADAAKHAYARVASNGPQALLQDKKVHSDLRAASDAAVGAKHHFAKPKKKKRGGFFRLLLLGTVGAAVAVAAVPSLRSKALDVVFGPEEELDYSSSAPAGAASVNGSAAAAAAADASASSASKN